MTRSRRESKISAVGVSHHQVTDLLRAWSDGDASARDRLMPLVYDELRRRAAARLRRERHATLQPTALVHEAYLRLVDQRRTSWQSRGQFFGVASEMMRRILVDRARARRAGKRSGRWARVTLEPDHAVVPAQDVDVLDLDAALRGLATFDPRKSRIAELRFFSGLSLVRPRRPWTSRSPRWSGTGRWPGRGCSGRCRSSAAASRPEPGLHLAHRGSASASRSHPRPPSTCSARTLHVPPG